MEQEKRIREIVEEAAKLTTRLECDGSTRVLNYLLNKAGIPHRVMVGDASYEGDYLPIHYWIVVEPFIIDNKIQMYFGNKVPQGVITDTPVIYEGDEVQMETSETVYKLLIDNIDIYWEDLFKDTTRN